jgi:hypothetical protein
MGFVVVLAVHLALAVLQEHLDILVRDMNILEIRETM